MRLKISNFSRTALIILILYSSISILFGFLFIEDKVFLPNFNGFIIYNDTFEPNYIAAIIIFIETIIGFFIGNLLCDSQINLKNEKKVIQKNLLKKGDFQKIIILDIKNKPLFLFVFLIIGIIITSLIYKISFVGIGFDNRFLKYSWASPFIASVGIYLGVLLSKVNILGYLLIHLLASFISLLIAYSEISRDFLLVAFPFLVFSSLYKFKNHKSIQVLAKLINLFTLIFGIYLVSFLRGGLRINVNILSFITDGFFYLTGFSFFNIAQQINGDISESIMSIKNLLINLQITKINPNSSNFLELKGALFDPVRPIPAAVHLYLTNPLLIIPFFILIGYLISKIFFFNKSYSIVVITYSAISNLLISFYQYTPRQFFRSIHILIFVLFFLYITNKYRFRLQ